MGADLYISWLFEANQARWQPQFEAAVQLRDSLPAGSAEREQAQERVNEYYEQMCRQGYFRDPTTGLSSGRPACRGGPT